MGRHLPSRGDRGLGMLTKGLIRDSLIVAAVVILFAWAASLTLSLILAYRPDGGDRSIPNPFIITGMYLGVIGLVFLLWRSQERPSHA